MQCNKQLGNNLYEKKTKENWKLLINITQNNMNFSVNISFKLKSKKQIVEANIF